MHDQDVRQWLAAIVDSSHDAIISNDLNGVILTWNKAAQRLFGYSEQAAIGQPFTIIVPPELHNEAAEILRRLRAGERIDGLETRRVARDGRYLDVSLTVSPVRDARGVLIGASKTLRDVTEITHAHQALRESDARFRLVANSAPVTIWMTDVANRCTFVNRPWSDLTGRPLHTALGQGWMDDLNPEDVERSWQTYTLAAEQREPFQMEYRVRRHDGKYRWMIAAGVPRYDENGSFAGYIGSAVDVTERKTAEEALSTISQRLLDAQDGERARLARELHDDVNQRLVSLNMRLDALSHAVPDSVVEGRERLEEARQDVIGLVTDIQALSHRLHPQRLQYLELSAAAAALCREISNQRGVEVRFDTDRVPEGLPKRIAVCLYRVLQEALQNAIKHSGTTRIDVALRGGPDLIELAITDFGVGFDLEAAHGHGLGLTSMNERLKSVQGHLVIRSQHRQGTSIRAYAPLRQR